MEFLVDHHRLDYRMHNKLIVVDNAVALIGGRNIGDQYFQVDPAGQFADSDMLAVGAVVPGLSATFDEFWNGGFAIPAEALQADRASAEDLREDRDELGREARASRFDANGFVARISTGQPLEGILTGMLLLVWARARLVSDSPDKQATQDGREAGRLMRREVLEAMHAVRTELLMVTPYLVPGTGGMRLLEQMRRRGVRVRILTNSLESSTELLAQAAYMHYRRPMLGDGIELYEVRSQSGTALGTGQSLAMSLHGNYSLHAKMFVFDRERIFVGSMNFDPRSMRLNTEIGLLIESPELSAQVAGRFEQMVRGEDAYRPVLRPGPGRGAPGVAWETIEDGRPVQYRREPARSAWQRYRARMLSWLPFDREM